jgi:hypothetical protein
VPIYISAAACCGFAVASLVYPNIDLLLMVFYLICAGLLFFKQDGVGERISKYNRKSLVKSMQADKSYIEKTREFFGLLIITAALTANYFSI